MPPNANAEEVPKQRESVLGCGEQTGGHIYEKAFPASLEYRRRTASREACPSNSKVSAGNDDAFIDDSFMYRLD